jgi:nicotinate-nucleotide adenylyltransferase
VERSAKAVALFGGSFDPVHAAHVAVAQAALRRFHLDRVIFIPSGTPPHKKRQLAAYAHRFAMVALACCGHAKLVVSLAEAGADQSGQAMAYSVDTVRRFRKVYADGRTRLYFIAGADQFLGISQWKDAGQLLELCDFIVANRPGFELEKLRAAIPPGWLGAEPGRRSAPSIALRTRTVYLLESVSLDISATEIRARVRHHQSIRGLVPAAVEEYIHKQGLYR